MPGFLVDCVFDPDNVRSAIMCSSPVLPDSEHPEQLVLELGSDLWIVDAALFAMLGSGSGGDAGGGQKPSSLLAVVHLGSPALVCLPCAGFLVVVTDALEVLTITPQLVPSTDRVAADEAEESDASTDVAKWAFTIAQRVQLPEMPSSSSDPTRSPIPIAALHPCGTWAAVHVVSGWVHFFALKDALSLRVIPGRLQCHTLLSCCFVSSSTNSLLFVPVHEPPSTATPDRKVNVCVYDVGAIVACGAAHIEELNDPLERIRATAGVFKVLRAGSRVLVLVSHDALFIAIASSLGVKQFSLPLSFNCVDALVVDAEKRVVLLDGAACCHSVDLSSIWEGDAVSAPATVCVSNCTAPRPSFTSFLACHGSFIFGATAGSVVAWHPALDAAHVAHRARGPIIGSAATSSPPSLHAAARAAHREAAATAVPQNWFSTCTSSVFAMQRFFELEVLASLGDVEGLRNVITLKGTSSGAGPFVILCFVAGTKVMCFDVEQGLHESSDALPLDSTRQTLAVGLAEDGGLLQLCTDGILATAAGAGSALQQLSAECYSAAAADGPLAVVACGQVAEMWSVGRSCALWQGRFEADVAAVALSGGGGATFCVALWQPLLSIECFAVHADVSSSSSGAHHVRQLCRIAAHALCRSLHCCAVDGSVIACLADGSVRVCRDVVGNSNSSGGGNGELRVLSLAAPSQPCELKSPATVAAWGEERFVIAAGRDVLVADTPHLDRWRHASATVPISFAAPLRAPSGHDYIIGGGASTLFLWGLRPSASASLAQVDITGASHGLRAQCVEQPVNEVAGCISMVGEQVVVAVERRDGVRVISELRSFDASTRGDLERLPLRHGEVVMDISRGFQDQDRASGAASQQIALCATAITTGLHDEPQSGRLLAFSTQPLRILASLDICGSAVYSVDVMFLPRNRSAPGTAAAPTLSPSHPALDDEATSWLAIVATLSSVQCFCLNGEAFAAVASASSKLQCTHVRAIAGTPYVVAGDFAWALAVYRVITTAAPGGGGGGLVRGRIVEAFAEGTPSTTTALGSIGLKMFLHADAHRNVFVDQLLTAEARSMLKRKPHGAPTESTDAVMTPRSARREEAHGDDDDYESIDSEDEDSDAALDGAGASGSGADERSSDSAPEAALHGSAGGAGGTSQLTKGTSLTLEAAFRLPSLTLTVAPYVPDYPYRGAPLHLARLNPRYQPPFPVRHVCNDGGAVVLGLQDGSVFIVSMISHEMTSFLVRLQHCIVGLVGEVEVWREVYLRPHTIVSYDHHRAVRTPYRTLPCTTNVVDGRIVRSWKGLGLQARRQVVEEDMQTEFPGITVDQVNGIVDALDVLA